MKMTTKKQYRKDQKNTKESPNPRATKISKKPEDEKTTGENEEEVIKIEWEKIKRQGSTVQHAKVKAMTAAEIFGEESTSLHEWTRRMRRYAKKNQMKG